MAQALRGLVGSEAANLSPAVVSRLKRVWYDEYESWRRRKLDRDRWVYLWADGIYSNVRLEDDRHPTSLGATDGWAEQLEPPLDPAEPDHLAEVLAGFRGEARLGRCGDVQ